MISTGFSGLLVHRGIEDSAHLCLFAGHDDMSFGEEGKGQLDGFIIYFLRTFTNYLTVL